MSSKGKASTCPINAALQVLGDRWSLLVVRDLMFAGYRSFNQFLDAGEGIATNVLSSRIEGLLEAGIVTREPDPEDGRKGIYRLTPKGVDLAPVLLELSRWGTKHEGGLAPPGILERWEADRSAFLDGLRGSLGVAGSASRRPVRKKVRPRTSLR